MEKCAVCFKKSSKQEHQCIVCNNVYETAEMTAKHQKDRGHIGGHHPNGGPLTRTRTTARGGRQVVQVTGTRDGTNNDEELLGLNEDEEEAIVDADDDEAETPPPPPQTTTNSAKRANDNADDVAADADDDVDDKGPQAKSKKAKTTHTTTAAATTRTVGSPPTTTTATSRTSTTTAPVASVTAATTSTSSGRSAPTTPAPTSSSAAASTTSSAPTTSDKREGEGEGGRQEGLSRLGVRDRRRGHDHALEVRVLQGRRRVLEGLSFEWHSTRERPVQNVPTTQERVSRGESDESEYSATC
jgi:hypothetical protein